MKRSEMLEIMAYHVSILTEQNDESALSTADEILTAQEQAGMVPVRQVIDGVLHTWEPE